MKSTYKPFVFFSLVFLWLILVMGGYFIYHKPFSIQQLGIWLKIAYQLLIGVVILACAGGIGLAILNAIKSSLESPMLQPVGLGLGILGLVYFIISWLFGIRWFLSLLLIGLLLIGFGKWTLYWLRNLIAVSREMIPKNRFSSALAILTFFLLVASCLMAVAPPLAFDALVYHLSLPLTYLQAGKFVYVPENTFWGMPQLGEMLYTLAMSLAGVEAGTILGWMIGSLSLLGISELLKGYLSPDEIWVSLATVLCGTTFVDSLSWGYVDWITFFYGVCVLQAFQDWFCDARLRFLGLSGIYCGFALGTKYTAGILALAGVLVIFFSPKIGEKSVQDGEKSQLSPRILWLVFFGLGCILISLPWWLRNLFVVGQPFYPLLFPAGEMSALRIEFYSGLKPFGTAWTAIFLPITATILGVEGKEGFNANIGPLFLLLAPFSLLFLSEIENAEKRLVKLNLLFALTGWVVWGSGSRLAGYLIQSRLYWAIFPSLAILSGYGYRKLRGVKLQDVRLAFILNNILLLLFALTTLEIFSSMLQKRVLDFVMGQIDSQTYLTHNLGWHFTAMQRTQELNQKTLLLFEPRTFYCLPNCDGDEILDEWYFMSLDASLEPSEVLRRWKSRGYQSVLVFQQGADFVRQYDHRYQDVQWELFDRLRQFLPIAQTFGTAYTLYRLP